MSIYLRPHHGMCFQFYKGVGYSEDFTDHMGKTIKELNKDPSQKIILKSETDIVCKNCPNNEAGKCISDDKVYRYDTKVLSACGLNNGDELSYADFIEIVKERIIKTGKRADICGECSWNYICEK